VTRLSLKFCECVAEIGKAPSDKISELDLPALLCLLSSSVVEYLLQHQQDNFNLTSSYMLDDSERRDLENTVLESDVAESVRSVLLGLTPGYVYPRRRPFRSPHRAPSGRRSWVVLKCATCTLKTWHREAELVFGKRNLQHSCNFLCSQDADVCAVVRRGVY
jgi:hypothetical protein